MTLEEVIEYIKQLFNGQSFLSLDTDSQQKAYFTAYETLKDYYLSKDITTRIVALQTLYMIESENEEYALLRRQGITEFDSKDTRVKIQSDPISPDVKAIIGQSVKKGMLGRLV